MAISIKCINPQRILYIRNDRIGDFLLNLPTIHAIKEKFPTGKMTVVVNPMVEELIQNNPDIDELIPFIPTPSFSAWIRLYRTLSKKKFDIIIVANPNKYFHLFSFLLKIPMRIGYKRKWPFFLTHSFPDKKHLAQKHEIEYNLDLVSCLDIGLKNPVSMNHFHLNSEKLTLPSSPYIVINPMTTSDFKQWPLEKFAELITVLHTETSCTLCLIGGESERCMIKKVLLPHLSKLEFGPRLCDFSGRITLPQLTTLLKHSKLLVSNDSGPVHMACAVQTPSVVLFGDPAKGSNPKRWGPWGEAKHSVVQATPIENIMVKNVWNSIQNHIR